MITYTSNQYTFTVDPQTRWVTFLCHGRSASIYHYLPINHDIDDQFYQETKYDVENDTDRAIEQLVLNGEIERLNRITRQNFQRI
ncbi:hypothetical protein [Moraxella boevrei]|uniref:hypothetical protein n=1 Tax=Faucicola boevrei TaxID=346665 RepID=UPI003736E75C